MSKKHMSSGFQSFVLEIKHLTEKSPSRVSCFIVFCIYLGPTNDQRMECPNDCSGNGKCLSMRQLALLATDSDLVPRSTVYGSIAGNISTWDADSVFGCYCDWMVRKNHIETANNCEAFVRVQQYVSIVNICESRFNWIRFMRTCCLR